MLCFKLSSNLADLIQNSILCGAPLYSIVLVGVLAGIVGYFLQQDNTLGWALVFAGVVLIIVGFIWKSQQVELNVVGMSEPWKFTGQRDTLDSLFRLVRERRV